ncbi:MAG TPA: hypothetical protein VN253_02220 [Kofleriaceae bacterium]|nr:hypothetical protein [Kofleriaceae bacterium]
MPSQKLPRSSFAVSFVKSGSRLSERPEREPVQLTASITVAPLRIRTSPSAAGLPVTSANRNVPAGDRPPFIAGSALRANTTCVPAVTWRQLDESIRSGLAVSPARSRPRPLRSTSFMARASNHSPTVSLTVAGLGMTSVITSSPGPGGTVSRIVPPSLHWPTTTGVQSLSWPGVPKFLGSNSVEDASHQLARLSFTV